MIPAVPVFRQITHLIPAQIAANRSLFSVDHTMLMLIGTAHPLSKEDLILWSAGSR